MTPVGIVAGSGIVLDGLFDRVAEEIRFPDTRGAGADAVAGHERKFIRGTCDGIPIVLQCGRFHFYEGLDEAAVVQTVDALKEFGVKTILFSCAAGGLKPEIAPGDFVAVDRMRLWRYRGWSVTPGMLFPDVVLPDCDFTGTYQWMHGPCYETHAEIAAVQRLGAEAIGMSTAPELARCQELGLRAAVIACITNAWGRAERITHQDVLAAARRASPKLTALIRRALPGLCDT